MSKTIRWMRGAALCAACAGTMGFGATAQASDSAGWFLGGMLAARLGSAIKQSVDAQKQQAAAMQEQNAMRMAPPPPPPQVQIPKTPQQKLQELDALAAGGYITPQEYKARRKAILDSL
ncbi:MAG: hypothetical protein LJE90_15850 [Betaproteobacteria bacterium]|jgi:hypothetical protein|nr:hypothetical protein [Betaproteobacteria bacterium]